MTELLERVVARLEAAQDAQGDAALRGQDAVGDALALLREAAPSPDGDIDLASVGAVCWTFWSRHRGPGDPEAQLNTTVALGTFGFLWPRVPADAQLPQPLRDAFDPADPAHDTRFAYLVSSAFGDAAGNVPDLTDTERLVAVERAIVWSDTAHEFLPEGHEGRIELALHAIDLHVRRFHLAADPDAFAVAAWHARVVLDRLASTEKPTDKQSDDGRPAGEAGAVALGVLLEAARLLGEPSVREVERLVAAAPEGAFTSEDADRLERLRAADAEAVAWPGERDLRAGALIVDAGIREHDAARIACGVRRLRTALDRTPAGHPAHAAATGALGRALEAFARERGEAHADAREAAREAAALLGGMNTPRLAPHTAD